MKYQLEQRCAAKIKDGCQCHRKAWFLNRDHPLCRQHGIIQVDGKLTVFENARPYI
jgi:hypothetical protein